MEQIIEQIFGYNNPPDLNNRFYDDLSKRLRNEPNKVDFLKELQIALNENCENHKKECEKLDCGHLQMTKSASNIIQSLINENMKEQGKITHKTIAINAPVYGHVGNDEVNGDYINNFAPIQQACEEAKLSIEQIAELKALFEKKDKGGLIEKLVSFGVHTAAIIAGHSMLHLANLG